MDLLYRTHARVAVSSTVANTTDAPDHLIDRRPETAWNGRTGDRDARITFHVPTATRVREVRITAGYDKRTPRGDLFTMNLRAHEVSIEREGRPVGRFPLDPEERGAQTISIDEPGGTFAIQVTDVIEGSDPRFDEIVVSELAVFGAAPESELLPDRMPRVDVGDLRRPAPEATGPFASLRREAPFSAVDAYCDRVTRIETELLTKRGRNGEVDEVSAWCRAGGVKPKRDALSAPFRAVTTVAASEGSMDVDRLLVATARGWYPTDVVVQSRDISDPGCLHSEAFAIDEATSRGDVLEVHAVFHAAHWADSEDRTYDRAAEVVFACALDARDVLACKSELVASRDGDDWVSRSMSAGSWDPHPLRWDFRREAELDDTGGIRLGPCVDAKGTEIACRLANRALLLPR